jgi:uncharacterized membrane protein YciS (DUF1049 family)
MTGLSNLAVIFILGAIAGGIIYTLTGLDRRLDDRKARRDADRFDVFTEGKWRE